MDNPLRSSHGLHKTRHSISMFSAPAPTLTLSEAPKMSNSEGSMENVRINNHSSSSMSLKSLATSATGASNQSDDSNLFTKTATAGKKRHHFSRLAKHISMTPAVKDHIGSDGIGLRKTSSSTSLGSFQSKLGPKLKSNSSNVSTAERDLYALSLKEAHKRDMQRWLSCKKSNITASQIDPLTYSSYRLDVMLEVYNFALKQEDYESLMSDKMDLLEYWSLSALKYLTGVNIVVSSDILTSFSNYDLKAREKLRILRLNDTTYGIQWAWQLAIDNPKADVYNYSLTPILYTVSSSSTDHKQIGPPNFHVIHGKSFFDLPFSRDSFSFTLAYSLFYTLKHEDWVPLLSELHRITQVNGSINLFLMDLNILNCRNKEYNEFIRNVQDLLEKKGIDHSPCKQIQSRLKEAGYSKVRYSFVTLKRGIPSQLGNVMEFLSTYFEFILFTKIASLELDDDELKQFKDLKLAYNNSIKKGDMMDIFGDSYFMLVLGEKSAQ